MRLGHQSEPLDALLVGWGGCGHHDLDLLRVVRDHQIGPHAEAMAKVHAVQAKPTHLQAPNAGLRPVQQPILVVQLGGKGNRLAPEWVNAAQDPAIEFTVAAMKPAIPVLAKGPHTAS